MVNTEIQKEFVEILKKYIPANINIAEEVSQLLNISTDSAYRRLRGETELTLSETVILCNHYSIPMESLINMGQNVVNFKINPLSGTSESFMDYLESILGDLTLLANAKERELIYCAEDLPVFYSFFFPALAHFKMVYWSKSILNVPEMQGLKVEEVNLPAEWIEKVKGLSSLFLEVNSTEVWNFDTLKSTLQQITFYWEAGFFKNKVMALAVITELEQLVDLLQKQCEMGKKMNYSKGQFTSSDYTLYFSELMIGNNTVFLKSESNECSYIGYNSFNYMKTTNRIFNEHVYFWIENLISKSTLISKVAQKQRNQFFMHILAKIQELHRAIQES